MSGSGGNLGPDAGGHDGHPLDGTFSRLPYEIPEGGRPQDQPFDWMDDDHVSGAAAGEATYATGIHKPTDPHEDIDENLDWINDSQTTEGSDDRDSGASEQDTVGDLWGKLHGGDPDRSTGSVPQVGVWSDDLDWGRGLLPSDEEPEATDVGAPEEGETETSTPTPETADGEERVVVWADEGHAVVVTKEEADARQASQQAAEKAERKRQAKASRKEKRKEFRSKAWERIQDFVEASKDWLREHPDDKRGRAVRYVGMAAVGTVAGVAAKHVPVPIVDWAEQAGGYVGHKGAGFLGGAATGYSDSNDHVRRSKYIAGGAGVGAGLAEGLVGTDGSVAAVVGFGAGKAAKRFKDAYKEERAAYRTGAEYGATEVESIESTTSSTSEPTSRPAVRPRNAERRPRPAKPAISDGVGQQELGRLKRGKGQR